MSNEVFTPSEDTGTPAFLEDLTAPPVEVAQASDTSIQVEEVEQEAPVQEANELTEAEVLVDGVPVTQLSSKKLTALKNKLRAEAERETLANHRDEYHDIASAKFAVYGLEFTRRLTDEERAEEQIQKLLASNPALAEKYTGK